MERERTVAGAHGLKDKPGELARVGLGRPRHRLPGAAQRAAARRDCRQRPRQPVALKVQEGAVGEGRCGEVRGGYLSGQVVAREVDSVRAGQRRELWRQRA